MRSRAFGAFAVALIAACTGDPPVGSGGASSSSGAGGQDGGGPDAAADAPIACKAPRTACGNDCPNLAVSGEHCGRCGHSCGGADCKDGVCEPMTIRAGVAKEVKVAVGKGGVFFVNGQSIETCPLTGCTVAPAKVATFVQQKPGPLIAMGSDAVFFQGAPEQVTYRPNIYHCPVTGACTLRSIDADGLGGFSALAANKRDAYTWSSRNLSHHMGCTGADCSGVEVLLGGGGPSVLFADDSGVYFVDGAGALRGCPTAGPCTPSTISPAPVLKDALGIRSAGGKLYVALPGDGANRGSIRVCNGVSCDPVTFSGRLLGNISSFAVDAAGVYWFTDSNALRACPIGGCGAAIRDVVTTTDASDLVGVLDGFLYYVSRNATNASIFRVATP